MNETQNIHAIRITDSLWEQLQAEADRQFVTRSELVRRYLVSGLEKDTQLNQGAS